MAKAATAIQFPDPNSSDIAIYDKQVAAWIRFECTSFNTLAKKRVNFERSSDPNDNYILPLQRYASPNVASYEDAEPSKTDMIFGGIRDLLTGDGQKIRSIGASLGGNIIADTIAGAMGEGMVQTSLSDLGFKNTAKRVHSFGFSLYAKNAKDAINLDTIANGFQTRLYPFLFSDVMTKPPPMWNISIVPNGGKGNSKVLSNNIGLSVLSNVSVSRLDKLGPVLTTNDYFLGLDITVSFTEIEPSMRTWSIKKGSNHEDIVSRSKASYTTGGNPNKV